MSDWTDRLAGARMQVDQRFQPRVDDSSFSNQEWGLIMTAVDFDIEEPDEPETAELVAVTDKLAGMIPELDSIQTEMGGSPDPVTEGPDASTLTGRFQVYLSGLIPDRSGPSDDERLDEARELVDQYAGELQAYLEREGRWNTICEAAARSDGDGADGD